jgi:hypothetical protein
VVLRLVLTVLLASMSLTQHVSARPASKIQCSSTQAMGGPVYSVKDFGVVGDGKADDQPAIDAAIARVSKLGGCVLLFPAGVYLIKRTIHLQSNVHLVGSGAGKTIIRSGHVLPDEPSVKYTTNTQVRGVHVANVVISKLTVQYVGPHDKKHQDVGISLDEGSHDSSVIATEETGQTKPALRATTGAANIVFADNYIHDTRDFGTGILLDGFTTAQYRTITNVRILRNKVEDTYPDSGQGGIAIWVTSGEHVDKIRIADNHIARTHSGAAFASGIRLYADDRVSKSTITNVTIAGNVATQNDQYGIQINTNGDVFSNLVIENNDLTGNKEGAIGYSVKNGSRTWHILNNRGT